MGLKVDCRFDVEKGAARDLVRVAGGLTAVHVADFLVLWEGLTRDVTPEHDVEVDLSDLLSVDAVGLDALRRVANAGTKLVGASHYIRMKLDSKPSAGQPR
jgi:hypothetical protein